MDYDDFIGFIEVLEDNVERIPKRYIRDAENPFDFYAELHFKRRYRFSKATVRDNLLPLIYQQLTTLTNRGLPLAPIEQLFVALRFYATGDFQTVNGDLRGVSQSSVSRIIKRVSELFARHLRNYVKYPLNHHSNIREFFEIAQFPGVSACIDGTHIPVKNPGRDIGEIFRNRKGIFSLNVQVAFGPAMKILDIVVRYPGSMHDNVMFQRSSLRIKYENNEIPGKILGDNGYACRTYLLTPVINPITRPERNYNQAHKRTRNIVERLFGIWKRRFPCLRRTLETKLQTSVAIICALAVLHNIAKNGPDDMEDDDEDDNEHENDFVVDDPNANGLLYRRDFIHILRTNS